MAFNRKKLPFVLAGAALVVGSMAWAGSERARLLYDDVLNSYSPLPDGDPCSGGGGGGGGGHDDGGHGVSAPTSCDGSSGGGGHDSGHDSGGHGSGDSDSDSDSDD